MKKENYYKKNGSTLASKAAFLMGAILLLINLQQSAAQCPVTISASGPVNLCTGGSVTLTASPGATYLWSTGATTQAITVATAGSYVVTVDDGNGCTDTSPATVVTLFSAIPGGITSFTGPTKACPGDTLTYSVAPPPRAVYYTWTLPTGATINGQSVYQTTSTSVSVAYSSSFVATGVISVVVTNGCGSKPPVNKTVSLNNPGTPAPISGPITTCANTTYTFSTATATGINSYNWTAPAGATITGQGSNTVDITFPAGYITGTISVSFQNGCGTGNARTLTTKSVPPKPQPITGPVSGLCGSTETYWIPSVIGATSYTWAAPAGSTVMTGQGDTLVTIFFNSNLNNGYVTVTADNACGASSETKLRVDGEVIISQNPIGFDLCELSTASLTAFAAGAANSYQWRRNGVNLVNGGNISGATSATLMFAPLSLADAGTYDVIVSNNCSDPDTSTSATVLVRPAPVLPTVITGADFGCEGTTGNAYSVVADPVNDSYQWNGISGATIATGQGTNAVTVDFGPSVNSGYTISVRAINSCGISGQVTKWIRRTVSIPLFATAPLVSCAGTSNDYSVTPVNGATSYTWIAPANATVTAGQGTENSTIDFGPSFTGGKVCVTATNQCMTTAQRCVNVVAAPLMPGAVTGESKGVCNTSQPYSINPVAGASGYTWVAPAGATITSGQGTPSVTVDYGPTFVTGDLSVVAENVCGDSPVRVRTIQAFPAKAASITGDLAPCVSSTGNAYSITPIPSATSYDWIVPAGATISGGAGTNSITVDFGTTAGKIKVRGVNACGAGFYQEITIAFGCRTISSAPSAVAVADIYPNPANDRITIAHQEGVSGTVNIVISDMTGRTLLNIEENVNSNNNLSEVNLSSLNNGIYMVEITTNQGKTINRIVKE
jgi:large repetitive protein